MNHNPLLIEKISQILRSVFYTNESDGKNVSTRILDEIENAGYVIHPRAVGDHVWTIVTSEELTKLNGQDRW